MVADSSYRCLETKISLAKVESFNPCFSKSRTRRGIWPHSSAISRSSRDPREHLMPNNNSSMKYPFKSDPGLPEVRVPHGDGDGPRAPPRCQGGLEKISND